MICPKCGFETVGNFCSNCGTALRERMDPEADQDFEILDPEDFLMGEDIEDSFRPPEREANTSEQAVRTTERAAKPSKKAAKSSGKESKSSGKEAKSSGKDAKPSAKELRLSKKEERLARKEERLARAERESERLRRIDGYYRGERAGRASMDESVYDQRRSEADGYGHERVGQSAAGESASTLQTLQTAAAKGAVTTLVAAARVMQAAAAVLMALMTAVMAKAFLIHSQGLGDIRRMVEEQNYGLALYVGFAGFTLFMGLIWCLWILSRKAAGGNIRLKTYDTGRGFFPFIFCLLAVLAARPLAVWIPEDPQMWRGLAGGAAAALNAVCSRHQLLFMFCAAGIVLSFVRKILRV